MKISVLTKYLKSNQTIYWILFFGVVLRVTLSFLPSFETDQSAFRFWSSRLADLGPGKFYSEQVFSNNPLGILYFFWVIGKLHLQSFDPILKLAAIGADLCTAFLIYKIVKEKVGVLLANIASLLYVLNPGVIFNSSIWGQYDSVAILFLLVSIYFLLTRKSPVISAIFFCIAWTIKPQSLELAPFLLVFFLLKVKPIQWIYSVLAFAITAIIVFLPFFPGNPLYGIYYVNSGSTGLFNCTTCFALNFWGIFGNWQTDTSLFLGLPLVFWGILLLIITLTALLNLQKKTENFYFLTISVSMLAFFMLLTRMHERYFAYFLPFMVLSAAILKSRILVGFYIFFSIIYLLNLYLPYAYYNNLAKITNLPVNNLIYNFNYLSFVSFFGFALLLIYYFKMFSRFALRKDQYILIAILILTFVIRVINLNFPKGYVFDEVYHAFTAKEYTTNSKVAWEWWTTPPPGVAYEWTHPPLAKEIMASSMILFNSTDSWAWRLPGVTLGTLNVFLVYLIANLLFKDRRASLLSAAIYSLDGLSFVQSRTGMNDVYLITFILTSLFFFIRKQFFYSSLFLGLALSSKWAAIYLLPVFFILLIKESRLPKFLYFLVIPLIIYLINYTPFFLLGHSPDQFIELQKQMWWYHTHLKATHNYASPWWSWPLNLYPIWYFVEYQGKNIANIFASGNPIIFWVGFVAVLLTMWEYFKTHSFALLVILLGYFAFWLPWAFSPRIMFLYHYAPSLPFLSLCLGYQLNLIPNKKDGKVFLIIVLSLMFAAFLFIYPFLTGVFLPKNVVDLFFMTNLTKSPF